MNWGYKILFVYLFFIAGILVLVYKSSSQKVDLVTKDYYQKELKYEQKIDEAERAQSLSSPLQYEVNHNKVSIYFPEEMRGKKITAKPFFIMLPMKPGILFTTFKLILQK